MSMPPLPDPWRIDADGEDHYSIMCMQAYAKTHGQQCREAALEEAVIECEAQANRLTYPSIGNAIALVCANKIRSLK